MPVFTAATGLLSIDCILKAAVLAGAYFLTGWLGLLLAIPPGYATAVWLPSGLALAGILRWGPRVWPGIWLGSFLVNVWMAAGINYTSLAIAASIAIGSTLQALLGGLLLQRQVGADRLFERASTVFAFAVIGALSCLLASTWGVTSLWLAGVVNAAAYFDSWWTWWLGDLMGVIVVTPLLLAWLQPRHPDSRPRQVIRIIGAWTLVAGITGIVFLGPSALGHTDYPLAFLPLPCLVWVAYRFDVRSTVVAILLLSVIAVCATSYGLGPFVRDITSEALFLLQVYIGLITLTGLSLASEVGAHQQAQKMRQVSEERLRLFITYAPAAVAMFDREMRYIATSRRWIDDYRLGEADIVGRSHYDLFPKISEQWKSVYRRGMRGESVDANEDTFEHTDGALQWLRWGMHPWYAPEGAVGGIVIFTEDITERKRAEDVLRQANEALERSNSELQRFAYVASHDLKTPMRSICSYVDLLHTTYGEKFDAQGRDWMRRTVASVSQLQALVNDLLEYSRVDSQARVFERLQLRDVFDDAVSLLDTSIREANASVTCGDLPAVMGDQSQLLQLMINLLNNGIKYRATEAPYIHVSAERGAVEWTISVRDNGIGIAPRHQERIFEIFKRLHDRQQYEGSGIGLAVCRRVVHLHGGRIWVESELGEGSNFRFTIPVEPMTTP